jgi:hypothetical protein
VDATRQEWAAKTLTFTPVTNVHMAASRIISEAAIKHAPFRNSDYSRYAGYFKITGIIRITGVAKELGRLGLAGLVRCSSRRGVAGPRHWRTSYGATPGRF